jgi:hypothetical protein
VRTGIAIFGGSMLFGLVMAAAYWFDTKEALGTILFGMMGVGLLWVAGYMFATRRTTRFDGDEERAPSELAGESIGVFATESPWPIVLAFATMSFVVGTVLHPWLAFFALIGLFVIFWELVREST